MVASKRCRRRTRRATATRASGFYASAWADCVIDGSHDNPGAVTAEQREAMQFGMQDGLATREQSLLLAEYHNQRNAKRALRLEDALYKRAGITGIKTHEGK